MQDRFLLDVYRDVWQDEPEEVRALSGLADVIPDDDWRMDDGSPQAQRYMELRDKVLYEPDFRDRVERAEALVRRVETERAAVLVEAINHYSSMPDQEVMGEAEDVHRRGFILNSVNARFGSLATDGWTSLFWSGIFMLITIMIVSGGIAGGIERACKLLMPLLLCLIVFMVVYGMFQPGFKEAVSFVFKPDPSKLKASGVLEALGHAFFTLSLGMGAMITYGSYQRSKERLASQSIAIGGLDTGIALLACLMIFPITFSYGQEPEAGPGLVFMSMPLAFSEIGYGGMFLAIIFFGLLVFAALTSSISLLEVVGSYFIDERGWSRKKAAWALGAVVLAVGALCAFASDEGFLMTGWNDSYGKNFFDTMDYLASNWMLPLGGLFIAIYAGWVMPKKLRDAELVGLSPVLANGWLMLVRFVAPALVIIVLMQKIGILDADELFHAMFAGGGEAG
ncbi:MAG: sodium-dependent transporter [Planctomycetota bacterium]